MRKTEPKIVCMLSMTDWIDSGVHKKAVSLNRHGYRVKVFVLQSRTPKPDQRLNSYDVFRIRLWLRRLLPRHLIFFFFKYLEFQWRSFQMLSRQRFDIMYCNDLETLPVGVLLKRFRGVRLVYVSDELNTEVTDLNSLSRGIWKVVETFCIRSADAVFTVNESISVWLGDQYRIPRPEILYNVPYRRRSRGKRNLRRMFGIPGNHTVLLYQGSMHPSRGVPTLLRIMPRIPDASLIVIGDQRQFTELVRRTHTAVPENVHVIDFVPYPELPSYTAGADIGLYLLENSCLNYYYSLPNKLFEFLAAGLPVVLSDFPEHRRIVAGYRCGILVNEKSDGDIVRAIRRLMQDRRTYLEMSRNARRITQETFNWETQEKNMITVFNRLNGRDCRKTGPWRSLPAPGGMTTLSHSRKPATS
ncbi:glycosyltransferase family 4 protein [bacterium]|nr:glycosyltransferase family 4 protein [bacterium]